MVTVVGFEDCLRSALAEESSAVSRRIAKRARVYSAGSPDPRVYLIATGQVKVIMDSSTGKECLLAIYTAGDFFGESCLSGNPRCETVIAMSDTVVKQVTAARFLALMLETGMMANFVRYLAVRLAEQQQVITSLATADSEGRLAAVLLRLSRKLAPAGSRGLTQKISHRELSEMIGTTRPRVSEFMQRFRDRGLIDITPDFRILVRERPLQQYLEGQEPEHRLNAVAS
jgi:CRP/FNR family transcriptional regulator, cyclic AMP receptor protein